MQKLTYEERRRRQRNKLAKQRTKYRKEYGLCIYCGEPTKGSRASCDSCLSYYREYARQKRAEREAAHQCTKCGKPLPDGDTHRKCETCRAKEREAHKRLRAVHKKK